VLELPAGKLEKDEDAFEAGRRELEEETGCIAEDYIDCGVFLPSPGYCGEGIHLYAAYNLKQTAMNLDEDEFLETERIPLEKAVDMVMKSEIVDGKSQVLILKIANLVREGKI
jgi:ADP-ribose pyrophosphatase